MDSGKIKGLIFDYGGTLDTGGDHWSEVIWDAWQKAGIDVDKALFREAYVYGERELARTLHILPEHNFHDLLKIKMNIELQYLAENGHFPAAEIEDTASKLAYLCYQAAKKTTAASASVLEKLSEKFPIVLVSNFYGNIETVLKDFGIRKYFKKIIESAVVGVKKPDPAIFILGAKALGLSPEEVLVIGDSYGKDIQPAQQAGFQTLWLKGKGWTAEEEAKFHPDTISSLEEALNILTEHQA